MPITRNKPQERKPAVPADKPNGKPKAGASAESRSLADTFDETLPQGQTAEGKYDAVLVEMVLMEADPEKGQSARASYEIATEGDNYGNRVSQFYKLINADGSKGQGLAYLKRDLAVLQKGDVKGSELEDAMAELTEEMPGVSITVKQNGQWTNVYLNGVSESDVIDSYKEKKRF